MRKSILITGCCGGIGSSLVTAFAEAGWNVIGTDINPEGPGDVSTFVHFDIARLQSDPEATTEIFDKVHKACEGSPLNGLINNAAVQTIAPLDMLTAEQISHTMNVNLIAPMLLSKIFCDQLKAAKGKILNIGSVHAQATKPEFAAYATSKAALHGLTRALAVDLGPHVQVNTLAPAATSTPMLLAGFEGNSEGFDQLKDVHPIGRIAQPSEIAEIAVSLMSDEMAFVTGSTFFADGGILSRLHDPS